MRVVCAHRDEAFFGGVAGGGWRGAKVRRSEWSSATALTSHGVGVAGAGC